MAALERSSLELMFTKDFYVMVERRNLVTGGRSVLAR